MTNRSRFETWLREVDALIPDIDDSPAEDWLVGKVWARLTKGPDLELHIRAGSAGGTEYVQLLDYIPWSGRYEGGVALENGHLVDLAEHLNDLAVYLGLADRYTGGRNQLRLF